MILYFQKILEFRKMRLLFTLVFKATQLQQRRKYDKFQKALFGTLISGTNLGIKVVPVVA